MILMTSDITSSAHSAVAVLG